VTVFFADFRPPPSHVTFGDIIPLPPPHDIISFYKKNHISFKAFSGKNIIFEMSCDTLLEQVPPHVSLSDTVAAPPVLRIIRMTI
jgi:hypothetical protein